MAIYLNLSSVDKNVILVTFDYTRERVKRIKTIKGRNWNPGKRYWTIPYTNEVINQIRKIFKDDKVIIDPSINIDNFNKSILIEKSTERLLKSMEEELILKGFSTETKKAYLGHVRRFLINTNKKYGDISVGDLKTYLITLLNKKNKSHAYVSQALSVIRFLFHRVLQIKSQAIDLPHPKKEQKFPAILSQEEVVKVLMFKTFFCNASS